MRARREQLGLRQRHMAGALGMTQPNYSYYDNGQQLPDALLARDIAAILKVDLRWLVEGTEEYKPKGL